MAKGNNKLKIILITLISVGLVLTAGVVAIKFLPNRETSNETVDSPDMSFEVVENTESDDISSILSQSSETDTTTDTDSDSTDTETDTETDTSAQENTSSQIDTDTTDRSSLYVDMSEILAKNNSSEYLNQDMVDYYEENPYPEYYPPAEVTSDDEIYTESTVTSSESESEIIDSSTDSSDEYYSSESESVMETDIDTDTETETEIPSEIPSETPSEDPVSSETTSSEPEVNDDPTPSKVVLDVPFYSQRNVMPTGCELVSAKMVLAYYGHNVSNQDIMNNLVRADLTYDSWGRLCGRNPFEAFIGNPEWYSGFGCYPPVIENMIHSMGFSDITVNNTSSQSLDELARTYIPQGKPIMVWATIGLVDSYWGDSWYLIDSNGNVTNNLYTWRANEHCMVLIGYDENYYYFNDPLAGSGAAKYEKSLVQRRYEEMGRYSLVISQY